MGCEPVFRPVLLPLTLPCRRFPTLTHRRAQIPRPSHLQQQHRRPFFPKPSRIAKNPSGFDQSFIREGLVGEALSGTRTREQRDHDMQQQQQQRRRQERASVQQQGSSRPLRFIQSQEFREATRSAEAGMATRPVTTDAFGELHHLHLYATKHNTHLTLTKPNRDPMLSLSTGNINFRKGHRGTFDAAYQLVTYSITQIIEKGLVQKIQQLEIVMRGHGPGREAFQKVLLGTEGRLIKPLIARVTDATRLKFGGTRSPSLRRL